jgi:hypothetical protein
MDNLPAPEKLPVIIDLWQRFDGKKVLSETTDAEIADLFGVAPARFTASTDDAFALRDAVFKGYDYVNVDLREYDDKRGLTFMCDLKTENGESSGRRASRPEAITEAVLNYVLFEMENRES